MSVTNETHTSDEGPGPLGETGERNEQHAEDALSPARPAENGPSLGSEPEPGEEMGSWDDGASTESTARDRLHQALVDPDVTEAARAFPSDLKSAGIDTMLNLARALAEACGDVESATRLHAELMGYDQTTDDVPEVRRVVGFASAFPVRALDMGLLDPDEIFSAGNEKFSQVTLTIGQPVTELEQALLKIKSGGVLALKVPASEVTEASAETDPGTEVYIYILPREIQRIVDAAKDRAFDVIVGQVVRAATEGSDD